MPLQKLKPLPCTIIGIDNGLRLAAVECPGGDRTRAQLHTKLITQRPAGLRCREAFNWACDMTIRASDAHGLPVQVFIESPFVSPRTVSAAIPLANIQGAVMAGAYAGGATTVYDIPPGQWKKRVIGSGSASKDDITEWMQNNWPYIHKWVVATVPAKLVQDSMDAAGLALYGIDTFRRATHLSEHGISNYVNLG